MGLVVLLVLLVRVRGRTAYEIPGRVVGGVDQGEIVVVLVVVLVLVLVGRVRPTPPPVHMYICTYVHMYIYQKRFALTWSKSEEYIV